MTSLFSHRSALKKLNNLDINWKAGITVQVLAQHPYDPNSIRWAHNVLEKTPTKIARYNNQPKPDGWGNSGGGLERLIYIPLLDKYLTEVEILEMRRPGHPILTDRTISEETRTILAGGLREFVDETGFRDIEIRTDFPGIFLSDYEYPPWADAKGVIHMGGHRKITLWGELTSFREDPIIESCEIDRTDWFDLTSSLPAMFFNLSPERPYWSHVRNTLSSILKIYRHEKDTNKDDFIPNIPRRIHRSWWYVFQVGRGDSRFPENGYRMSPRQWYKLFELMVAKKMEEADRDFLLKFLGKDLDNARRVEENQLNNSESEKINGDLPETTQEVEDSEDSEGIPTVEEMIRREDEEYARWLESELGIRK